MRVLILLNGDCPASKLVKHIASACAVLCADGGARHAARLGLKPRFVIGDMDSLPSPLPRWKDTVYLCDFDENCSDFEKALAFAAQIESPDIYVAGALGGRMDHVLANLCLMEKFSRKLRITLVDKGMARLAAEGRHELPCRAGQVVSLIAGPAGAVVTTQGLKYPLRREKLPPGSRGLSNVAVSEKAAVQIHTGQAWIVTPA